jgi:hypothetical protein
MMMPAALPRECKPDDEVSSFLWSWLTQHFKSCTLVKFAAFPTATVTRSRSASAGLAEQFVRDSV